MPDGCPVSQLLSSCGRVLVDCFQYSSQQAKAQAAAGSKALANLRKHLQSRRAYLVLVHHVISSRTTHQVMTGLPMEAIVDRLSTAWQSYPLSSPLYAWASALGPVYLIDAHQHCVLTRLHLDVKRAPCHISIRRLDRSVFPCLDESLWYLAQRKISDATWAPGPEVTVCWSKNGNFFGTCWGRSAGSSELQPSLTGQYISKRCRLLCSTFLNLNLLLAHTSGVITVGLILPVPCIPAMAPSVLPQVSAYCLLRSTCLP